VRTIRIDEDVLARDGRRLGLVDRIVVDARARRVTHVVVGDRAIPVERLRDAAPHGLAADLDAEELESLPDASEPPFAAPGEGWEPPEGYRLEHFLALVGDLAQAIGPGPFQPPVHIETGASELHEITAGSPVWTGDHQVGHVDRLLWDGAGKIAAIIVKPGLLGHLRRVPVASVRGVAANNVHLAISREQFQALPDWDPLHEPG
jgi:hypothetical protein